MNKTLFLVFIIIVLALIISACSTSQGDSNITTTDNTQTDNTQTGNSERNENIGEYKKITAQEGKKMLDENENILLLDVRTEEEYNEGHIPDSILIPYDIIKDEASEKLKDKEQTIIIYCRSGRRSAIAANELIGIGYKNVYDMGGIIDWPYETVKP